MPFVYGLVSKAADSHFHFLLFTKSKSFQSRTHSRGREGKGREEHQRICKHILEPSYILLIWLLNSSCCYTYYIVEKNKFTTYLAISPASWPLPLFFLDQPSQFSTQTQSVYSQPFIYSVSAYLIPVFMTSILWKIQQTWSLSTWSLQSCGGEDP